MAAANGGGNGTLRSYLPLLITVVLAVAPVLVLGGRMINRLDYLETSVRERSAEINDRVEQVLESANSRWAARDRQAESGDQRIRALAEALIAQQRDAIAATNAATRQDEAVRQMLARLERLVERFNQLERELRPYQPPLGPQQRDHQ